MMTKEERDYVQELKDTIADLQSVIARQAKRIAELERRLNMDSSNSSKPPSTDGFKRPKNRSLRKPSGKKPGGQKGHAGAGLSLPRDPDVVVKCRPNDCIGCPNADLCAGRRLERRYLVDAEVAVRMYAYDQMEFSCPKKGNETIRGEFPEGIRATKQYGNRLKALVVALNSEGAVSVQRIHDLLHALTSASVSTGFIQHTIQSFADSLDTPMEHIRKRLLEVTVVNGDETGTRTGQGMAWLHNASNHQFTYQAVSEKRGKEGIEEAGFFPEYKGISVHDCWAAYWAFPAERHGICLAHILRELQGVLDNDATQSWAKRLKGLLLEMKRVKERLLGKGKAEASRYYFRKFRKEWDVCIGSGKEQNPLPEKEPGKRSCRSKARCLVDRLEKYADEAWLFFRDFRVPFDNNQAERDVRPAKTKLKVCGCFRTIEGAQGYAKIRSVISTTKKHGLNVFHTILSLFNDPGAIPWEAATE